MPTYQYACTECDNAFEQFQSFSDDALTVCPQCEGRLRKIFNAVGVVFKGSGFYRNDSRTDAKSGNGSSEKTDSSGDSGSKDTGTTKTEKSSSDSGSSPSTSTPAASTSSSTSAA